MFTVPERLPRKSTNSRLPLLPRRRNRLPMPFEELLSGSKSSPTTSASPFIVCPSCGCKFEQSLFPHWRLFLPFVKIAPMFSSSASSWWENEDRSQSMIDKLAMGYFDIEALKSRKLLVLRPLDTNAVRRLLQEVGNVSADGRASLGGHLVEIKDGYIICPWLMAQRVPATEEFARRMQQETGCVLYDPGRREIVTLKEMAGW
jgi:hypothetical protein